MYEGDYIQAVYKDLDAANAACEAFCLENTAEDEDYFVETHEVIE
jgi:hypothetical protein